MQAFGNFVNRCGILIPTKAGFHGHRRVHRLRFCLNDKDVLTLADYAIKIEKHYSKKAGVDRPMDMEWAKDGTDGGLYMVQARPETVESQKDD